MARVYMNGISIPEHGTWPSALALVVGLAYGGIGGLQLLVGIGLVGPITGFTDLVGGLLLMIAGAVFLTGVRPLSKNEQEGYAFIAVGFILAAVLFFLQAMVIATNGLGRLLGFQDWLGWNIYNDITPSFWLFLILITGTGFLWVTGILREKLVPTLKGDPSK